VRLLEPDGRRVRLTPAGQLLAKRAETILGALREAADEVTALGGDATGELRLATFPSVAAALCPTVPRVFGEPHPRHRIRLSEMETAASSLAVVAGEVDLAIVDEPYLSLAEQQPVTAHRELVADPLYCVLPAGHRLAELRTSGCGSSPVRRGCSTIRAVPSTSSPLTCDARPGSSRPRSRTPSRTRVSTALVRSGAGVAILPGLALAGVTDLAVRPVRPRVTRRLSAVYRRGANQRPSPPS